MQQFTEYLRQFRRFQRNTRLFLLIYTLFGLSTGIGLVLYPLYLSALGYGTDFIGLQILVGTLGAGLTLVPAGFCVDRFGGKPLFFCAGVLIAIGGVIHVLFRSPVAFLSAAFIGGIGGAIVLVLYSPFLTRNSTPAERPHLFSLSIVVNLVATVLGEIFGGAWPTFLQVHSWAMFPHLSWFLVSAPLARSYQITLTLAVLLGLPAFLPIFFITNDRPTPLRSAQRRFWFPLKRVRSNPHNCKQGPSVSRDTIGSGYGPRVRSYLSSPLTVLMGVNMLLFLGAGIFLPYIGLFFVQKLGANSAQFGMIDGAATGLNVLGTLLAPWIVMRIGRVTGIVLSRLLAIPALLCVNFFPLLPLAVILYPLRQVLNHMMDGILQTFSMEAFSPQRRGLSNSVYQGAGQVAQAIATPIGGLLIRYLGYTPVFLIMAVSYSLGMALFWWRFGRKPFVTSENTQEAMKQALGEQGNITAAPEYAEQGHIP